MANGSFISKISNIINSMNLSDKTKKAFPTTQADNVYLNGSISNATKDLIMTFPVLCDNSLPPATASMISRANERYIVTMLQLLFSSMQFNEKDGRAVLSKIHKNIKTNYNMDDAIDSLDKFVASHESASEAIQIREAVKVMMEQLRLPQKSFPVENFNERSVNDYMVRNVYGRTTVMEANPISAYDLDMDRKKKGLEISNLELEKQKKQSEIYNIRGREERDSFGAYDIKKQQYDDSIANAFTRQLLDTDVKKANEMQPTLMIVKFNEIDDSGEIYDKKPFIAGVKSRLIPVDSYDIVDRINVKNKTKINFLNFIRATSGEIGLVKDFIFCIDQNKIDAKNSAKKGEAAAMWKVLEQRSSKNFLNKNKRSGNDASAITTLVISQETVNLLKKEYDYDIEKISNARAILDAYNLLGIIIADESIEVVKFLYAGNDSYEQQAYSYLERESNDNSYKKVVNLIGRMNGR